MLKLILKDETGKAMEFPLTHEPLTIGRAKDNTVMLDDMSISRNHARVTLLEGTASVEDLGSKNRVLVNGAPIPANSPFQLSPGDEAQMGIYLFTLHSGAETGAKEIRDIEEVSTQIEIDAALSGEPGGDSEEQEHAPESSAEELQPGKPSEAEKTGAEEDGTFFANDKGSFQIPKLVITAGDEAGREYLINKDVLTFGRAEDNDIFIDDSSMSRYHAQFLLHGDGSVSIKDMGSENGILINGERIDETLLSRGDNIKIGETLFRYVEKGEVFTFEKQEEKPEPGLPLLKKFVRPLMIAASIIAVLLIVIFMLPVKEGGRDEQNVPGPENEEQKLPEASAVQLHIDRGSQSLKSRDWSGAIDHLNRALALNAQSLEARILKEQAESELRSLEALKMARLHAGETRYGAALQEMEKIPDTSVYYQEARAEFRKNLLTINGALAVYSQGKADEALSMLREIKTTPKNQKDAELAEAYIGYIEQGQDSFQKGTDLYSKKDVQGAFKEWKQTLLNDKKLPLEGKSWYAKKIAGAAADELYKKGLASFKQGDREAAVRHWKKAVGISPDHKGALSKLEDMARRLYREGYALEDINRNVAIQKWKEILTIVPPGSEYYKKAHAKLKRKE